MAAARGKGVHAVFFNWNMFKEFSMQALGARCRIGMAASTAMAVASTMTVSAMAVSQRPCQHAL